MSAEEFLRGKRVLAVDDEEDVLAVIQEQLQTCNLICAGDFETAATYLEHEDFDLVILDVMGVRGFDLLDITRDRQIPTVMLTAHALTPEGLQRSIDEGAVSFLPKEDLSLVGEKIAEILENVKEGKSHWPKLVETLGPRFKQLWGSIWDKVRFPKDAGPED
jgi:CheY-like chemotaxis protein